MLRLALSFVIECQIPKGRLPKPPPLTVQNNIPSSSCKSFHDSMASLIAKAYGRNFLAVYLGSKPSCLRVGGRRLLGFATRTALTTLSLGGPIERDRWPCDVLPVWWLSTSAAFGPVPTAIHCLRVAANSNSTAAG